MVYDKDFYLAYQKYLLEPAVRTAHDFIFRIANLNPDFREVVDLGCGASNEFYHYANPNKYAGVDMNIDEEARNFNPGIVLLSLDYRKVSALKRNIPFNPTAFVSLFSTEITAPYLVNYEFYERIFSEFSSINSGLVSGFYYATKKLNNPITENGGLVSYQTLESLDDIRQNLFEEIRITLPVPSSMFGQDVYEVWKLFSRK